jgi:dynein heavy chain
MLNVFYQGSKRNEWSSIPTERIELFFKTVSFILADQLRYIVEQSVTDFVNLFDGNVASAAQRVEGGKPLAFAVRLVLDGTGLRLEPSPAEILGTVETLFDLLLVAADKIPRIETQLFANGAVPNSNNRAGTMNVKPDQCIKVQFEGTLPAFTENARRTLRASLQKLLEAPQAYMSEFDKHKSLISRSAENDLAEFLSVEQTFEKMSEEVKKYRHLATVNIHSAYPFVVNFPLVELHSDELIKDLSDRALSLANQILDKMALDNRTLNQR